MTADAAASAAGPGARREGSAPVPGMRIDVVSIFPEYLRPLELSLVGKARERGVVDIAVHDLRRWATDRHRTVDDTPAGGGAGMVMRPDVWGLALDEILAQDPPAGSGDGHAGGTTVLLIPTPSGRRFTQRFAEELAGASRLVIACGRYEGIDARVAEHYGREEGIVVQEFSLGDYVLNGGEVAALVVTEAVTRLLPGVLGNPGSLVEESHGAAGLLEYPVYTRPALWRGLEVPEVLTSGHHGRIARWRRDRSLQRTAERRPDILHRLREEDLDADDRRVLGELGRFLLPAGATRAGSPGADAAAPSARRLRPVSIRPAVPADAPELAAVAARTFPLACPTGLSPEHIESFVTTALSAERFEEHLADPRRRVLVAERADGEGEGDEAEPPGGGLLGYTLTILGSPPPAGGAWAEPAELSKCYVVPEALGTALAGALLTATMRAAADAGARSMWLGTNVANRRAQRFYRRHDFVRAGRRTFEVGGEPQDDVVMARRLR